MFKSLLNKGRKFLTNPQTSVLSAASLIMIMVIASRLLGLVRQRVLAHFFLPEELSLFFAAFRLPDLVFEVLVFGTFSSAFIPVFTKMQKEKNAEVAWQTAGFVVNIGLLVFLIVSLALNLHAGFIYEILAPGYSGSEREVVVGLSRILFAAQGFFIVSFVLTGVLESMRRFLFPALAPLFYNMGIIFGTTLFAREHGLYGPVFGVVAGAALHFLIQLPLARKLGFRFVFGIKLTEGVKKIVKLALPRLLETGLLQISKTVELAFSTLVSTAAYTYYTFGNSIQLLPVGIFGVSIAKAALPALASESSNVKKFRSIMFSALYDMCFLIIPMASILVVLRIPLVRLVYGTDIFGWEATVQTGYVVSVFALGIVFQAASALLARSFYAIHDTKTPVGVSVLTIIVIVVTDFILIRVLGFNIWGLAAGSSLGSAVQACLLLYLINKKTGGTGFLSVIKPIFKSIISAFGSGSIMYFLLKIFDRSVWIKRLSFIDAIDVSNSIPFEKFVLDTRYTINLLILTLLVSIVGATMYIAFSLALGSKEVWNFFDLIQKMFFKRKVMPIPQKEAEAVSPTPTESAS